MRFQHLMARGFSTNGHYIKWRRVTVMIDLAVVKSEFPEVTNLAIVSSPSGQKEVLKGTYKAQSVALKLIKPWPSSRDVEYERVQREVLAAAKLNLDYIPII